MRKIDLRNCVSRSSKLSSKLLDKGSIDKGTPNKLFYDTKLKCHTLLIGSKGTLDSTKVMVDGKEVLIKGLTFECSEEAAFVLLTVLEGDEIVVKSLDFLND